MRTVIRILGRLDTYNTVPDLKQCERLFLAGIRILTINAFSPQMVRISVIGRHMRPTGSISGGNMNPTT